MWTKIKDFPNYEAHPDGLVRSLGKRGKPGTVLKPQANVNRGGYLYISLCNEQGVVRKALHRVIAETFLENPHSLPTVNHVTGDKTRCAAVDLEWCTYKENTAHAIAIGLITPSNTHPVTQCNLDGTMIKEFPSINDAARELGISRNLISNVVRGNKKTTHGFIFEYRKEVH